MKVPFIRKDGTGFYVEMAQKSLEDCPTIEIPEPYEFTDWGHVGDVEVDFAPPPRRSYDRVKFQDKVGTRWIYIESR